MSFAAAATATTVAAAAAHLQSIRFLPVFFPPVPFYVRQHALRPPSQPSIPYPPYLSRGIYSKHIQKTTITSARAAEALLRLLDVALDFCLQLRQRDAQLPLVLLRVLVCVLW